MFPRLTFVHFLCPQPSIPASLWLKGIFMPPEIKNFLITVPFGLILLVILIWLIKALIPSAREQAKMYRRDKFELAGYETITDIRRKEYAVISLSVFVIILCLAVMGGLIYLLVSAGFGEVFREQAGMNIFLVFIPAVVLLVLVVKTSGHYIKTQQHILQEFRRFRTARDKAIAEYEDKRSGKDKKKKEEAAAKNETVKRVRVSDAQAKAAQRHRKRVSAPKQRKHF